MTQTKLGAAKAVAKIKAERGEDHYQKIGRMGGLVSKGGSFASDSDLAARAGKIGGTNSSRKGVKNEV